MKLYDFNLLRVLDAVLSTGSVTAAAERLHLSVPATSHALARLRETTGDPLLVRAGRRLVPTPRAAALREPVAGWVAQAQALLAPPTSDALSSLERRFVVRAPDGIPIAFGAAMAVAMAQVMPRAELHFVSESFGDASALREGRIDLDLGNFLPREPEVQVLELFRQTQVAVVRAGHPLATAAVTARRYAAQGHVAVQVRPQATSPVDDALAELGLARRVVVTVAHANATPIIAARCDLVATISERMALVMAPSLGAVVLPLPFLPRPQPLVMAWHPRHDTDPAHAWLRAALRRAIDEVGQSSGHKPLPQAAPPAADTARAAPSRRRTSAMR